MILYYVFFILALIFLTCKMIMKFTNNINYRNTNILLWIFYLISIIFIYYEKFLISGSIFSIGILISLFIIFRYVKIDDSFNNFSFWGLFILTSITLGILLATTYFYKSVVFKEPPIGNKGRDGNVGQNGNNSEDLEDIPLCISHLKQYSNYVFSNWNNENGENKYKINNLYFNDQIKKICNSKGFENSIYEIGVVNTIQKMKKNMRNIILFILEYNNGSKFLDEHLLTDYHWKDMIQKTDKYQYSPFDKIKNNEIWRWCNCKNLKFIDIPRYNKNNLCRK